MLRALRRRLDRARLADPRFAFLFDEPPADEVVALDCETTGLDRKSDEIVTVAAIRIRDTRILTSERFEATAVTTRKSPPEAIKIHRLLDADTLQARPIGGIVEELLHFIGPRPILGYYTEFDVAMLNRPVRSLIGIGLPNRTIDVSGLYYDLKYGHRWDDVPVDLRFASILRDLKIAPLGQHDAFNDALMTAMIYVQLADMARRGARIPGREGPAKRTGSTGGSPA